MDPPIDLTASDSDDDPMTTTPPPSPDLVLLIYVHGFKGTDVTFEAFPERLEYLVQQTIPNVRCETRVFPVYETRGSLLEATERFVDWLTHLTVQLENAHAELGIGGAGKAKIMLCGHSMGGLLIADAALKIRKHAVDKTGPLWPRIIAVIGFDSPYLGLSPGVFKNSISKYASHVETAKTVFGAIAPTVGGLGGLGSTFGFGTGSGAKSGEVPRSAGKGGDAERKAAGGSKEAKEEGNAKASGSKTSAWGFGGWGTNTSSTTSSSGGSAKEYKSRGESSPPGVTEDSNPQTSTSGSTPTTSSRWWTPTLPTLPTVPTSSLATFGALGAVAAAAAGTAYYRRGDLAMGWGWVSDHILYVSNLWDSEGMKRRGRGLLELVEQGVDDGLEEEEEEEEEEMDMDGGEKDGEARRGTKRKQERIVYRNFYTYIPPEPPNFLLPRTFCILPATNHPLRPYWRPVTSSFVEDEVSAHIGMFNAKTNEAFSPMGLEVAQTVVEAVERAREVDQIQ